ncbi:hypothetical protein ABEB36_008831 [Hypothenemus hampei]|uniref:H/ACA ribonucleoprotein complex non-core subunit NAF1 n=1 Tax=Hypothenemus hampei TaxID=57062 RepID=A0ABD1ENV3_HYPHA
MNQDIIDKKIEASDHPPINPIASDSQKNDHILLRQEVPLEVRNDLNNITNPNEKCNIASNTVESRIDIDKNIIQHSVEIAQQDTELASDKQIVSSELGNSFTVTEMPQRSLNVEDVQSKCHINEEALDVCDILCKTTSTQEHNFKEVTKLNIPQEELKINQGLLSKVVLNKQSDSLKNLMCYDSDSSSQESDVGNEVSLVSEIMKNGNDENKDFGNHRSLDSDSSDSDSDSNDTLSELESASDDSDSDSVPVLSSSVENACSENSSVNKGAVKKTTIGYEFDEKYKIPDLSKLTINADTEFMHIGRITAIIADIVTVTAIPGTPTFDLDSMLFINNEGSKTKKFLGPIYDVLGQVSEPMYCVRFNSEEDIKAAAIKTGMQVFAAPKSDEFTKYVFVKELLKIKGSDASWLNDQEQPVELIDYSDDEEEKTARTQAKGVNKRNFLNSLERHRRTKNISRGPQTQRALETQFHSVPPEFNPAVPPPGYGYASPYAFPTDVVHPAFGQPANFSSSPLYNTTGFPYLSPHYNCTSSFSGVFPNQEQVFSQSRGSPGNQQTPVYGQNPEQFFTNNNRSFKDPGPSK